ncbi:TPA: hypothetical protein F3L15_13010 [Aeromonas hydrophila]|uniref:DUF637 domain-containing protein n=1 Tax=Aeromonas hydrophila TaxID=644 RepID=UPI0009BA493C|nr:DUF637 domain-containing protein [Aeromonas hydrophila]HAU4884930.1 hypothetical protein [Aeromonas hydrophila]
MTSHSVVTAGINTTINGSHFADAFKASLLSNIQGEVGKATANWIGAQGIQFDTANSPLAGARKIAAHGVTNGAIAEITGGKFAAGAAGGAMSEHASNWSSQVFSDTEHQVALNKVLGGLAAVAVTGDQNQFDTGAERAETVYRYNSLQHMFNLAAEAKMADVNRGVEPIIKKADEEAKKETLKETLKTSAYIVGAVYLGPAAAVESVLSGSSISTMANVAYQWYDLSQPGNENKSWNYLGSANTAVTGALAPGRGIKGNIGIAIGSSLVSDDFSIDKAGVSGGGAALVGAYGKYIPGLSNKILKGDKIPGFVFEITGSLSGEFFTGYSNKLLLERVEKKRGHEMKYYLGLWLYSCLFFVLLCFLIGGASSIAFYFKEGEFIVPKGEVERGVTFGFIAGTSISIYVFVVSLFKKSEKKE